MIVHIHVCSENFKIKLINFVVSYWLKIVETVIGYTNFTVRNGPKMALMRSKIPKVSRSIPPDPLECCGHMPYY